MANEMTAVKPSTRRIWGHPVIGLIFRIVLAGILAFAGISKLLEPSGARSAIIAYRIPGMTGDIAGVLGWLLPAGEVLLAKPTAPACSASRTRACICAISASLATRVDASSPIT